MVLTNEPLGARNVKSGIQIKHILSCEQEVEVCCAHYSFEKHHAPPHFQMVLGLRRTRMAEICTRRFKNDFSQIKKCGFCELSQSARSDVKQCILSDAT
jgi:hypothetical protein